jgi:hypothetical protein
LIERGVGDRQRCNAGLRGLLLQLGDLAAAVGNAAPAPLGLVAEQA